MNITEVENIVETLLSRHSDLDENMLRILLKSGGFEDKIIEDAVVVYRNKKTGSPTKKQDQDQKEQKDINQSENPTENPNTNNESKEEKREETKVIKSNEKELEEEQKKEDIVKELYSNDKKSELALETMPPLPKDLAEKAKRAIDDLNFKFENHILFSTFIIAFIMFVVLVLYMYTKGRI